MDLASIRLITDDLEPVIRFYEQLTGVSADRLAPVFAELRLPSCTIAFGQTQTAQLFNNAARPADNHSMIIEFRVDDVDQAYERFKGLVSEWVQEPTTMPWGNRSALLRDPDGNLVNLFAPVTEEAVSRFSGR
jgi:predicted enzyme related to lactoylglutathione lyase